MLESSEGSFINRDSLGDRSEIGPGDIHWTWSGSGVMHEEVPKVPGVICNGLQIFVNMPEKFRHEAPQIFHAGNEEMPHISISGGSIKIVAGEYAGLRSPVRLPTPLTILDLNFSVAAEVAIEVPTSFGGLLVHTAGSLLVEENPVGPHQALGFANEATSTGTVTLRALAEGRAVLLMGRQVSDPLYFAGSLAAGSESSLKESIARYQAGQMGHLTPSF